MEKVYISGPIESDPDYEEKFAKVEELLSGFGYIVVNPVKVGKILDNYSPKKNSRQDYMKAGIRALLECDGIFFLDNAEESKGSMLERRIAEECGISTLEFKLLNKNW